ncbi:MAG: hypothetical protein NTX79_07225 [Candidatus Micrarchaeota archaeon]|nr:hypothetical protein [Candidatus Micrarchaeota archaeon]
MEMVLRALAFAAMASLLFFGCVSEPKPSEGMQGIVVQNAEKVIGNAQPSDAGTQTATPPQSGGGQQVNCTLAVKQSAIVAGEQVDIALNSRFSGSATFDLACGEETRRLVSENTLALETKCKFDTPGTQNITVMANGRECASAVVEVRKKAGGACSIDSGSIERDFASFQYRWIVYFDGFSEGDTLAWVCDSTVSRKRITSDPVWGMPRYEILSCGFPGKPLGDYINVSISGVPCGQVSTRQ